MSKSVKKESAGGRVVLATVAGVVLLLGGGYAGTQLFIGDKAPRGTEVLGTDIGGKTRSQARSTVMTSVSRKLGEPVTLTIDGKPHQVTPEDWGVSVDDVATVEAAGAEKSWSPSRLVDYFTSGDEVEPVLAVDTAAFDTQLTKLNDKVGTAAADATLSFKGSELVTTEARNGHGVDADATQKAILEAVTGGKAVDLALSDVEPRIGAEAVQQAKDSFANAAVSAPVTISFGESSVKLAPSDFTPALSFVPRGDVLEPALDTKKLDAAIKGSVAYKGKPVDATVKFVQGKPKVIPAKPGVTYDAEQLDNSFLDAVRSTDSAKRTLTLKAVTQEAEFSTADAEKLGIKEKVSSFTTEFPYAEYRNVNIGRAAELVNGTVLKPGEIFSLNKTVGERTRENGFTEGFMIADGVFKSDLGGGVSQMATTTYNAMFFAGYEDIEHKPHSFYISRYPVGREATVAWGSLDLRFKNDTQYGTLIRSYLKPATPGTQGSVTVEMWSTKVWDITTTTSERYNYRGFKTRYITTPGCESNSGWSGFDVDYTRNFLKPGTKTVVKTEKFHTAYTPSDTVVCGPPPAPKKADAPAPKKADAPAP